MQNAFMKNAAQWLTLAVILSAVVLRLVLYGDVRLAVATSDTESYENSSQVNLLSWDAFTAYRPYTTNLIYKTFAPADGYQYRALSTNISGTVRRRIEPGFEGIAVLQSITSMVAWSFLAWSFSRHLKNGIAQVGSAAVIMLFAFTPQIADWDSVMGAESLSISLFAFSFGILIWLSFKYHEQQKTNLHTVLTLILFMAVVFLWVFTRDVNAYAMVCLALVIFGLFWFPRFRADKLLLAAGLFAIALFALGATSARQRPLWQLALTHVWEGNVLPSESNVEYFTARGMPTPGTPEYAEWFQKDAPGAYLGFLLDHPAYTTHKFFRDLDRAFSENMQPYFNVSNWSIRPLLIMAGNYLHARSGTVFFVGLFLLLTLYGHAVLHRNTASSVWAWLMTWAFLTAGMTMFFTIFGDTYGLIRHALSSAVTYRLLLWLLLFLLADLSLQQRPSSDISH
jgi:hypothetical protein